MHLKSAAARFKAADDGLKSGEFEAVVSVFGNIDRFGDVVMPGAFANTIAAWKSGPDRLPVLWSHRFDDPAYNIGEVLDIRELEPEAAGLPEWVDPAVRTGGGLWVKARIDTGPEASPIAVQALRLLRSRRVSQFSYAYDEVRAGPVTVDGVDAWGLHELAIYEVGPTQLGVNDATELIAAKSERIESRDKSGDDKGAERKEPETATRQGGTSIATVRLLSDLARMERAFE